MRTIEVAQRQAAVARALVRQLEQPHLEQAARISQGGLSLQRLQELIRESIASNQAALQFCETLEHDLSVLKSELESVDSGKLSKLTLRRAECPTVGELKERACALESALAETSLCRSADWRDAAYVCDVSDCNPLNDLQSLTTPPASVGADSSSTDLSTQQPQQQQQQQQQQQPQSSQQQQQLFSQPHTTNPTRTACNADSIQCGGSGQTGFAATMARQSGLSLPCPGSYGSSYGGSYGGGSSYSGAGPACLCADGKPLSVD